MTIKDGDRILNQNKLRFQSGNAHVSMDIYGDWEVYRDGKRLENFENLSDALHLLWELDC